MSNHLVIATLVSTCLASSLAHAEFSNGNLVAVNGAYSNNFGDHGGFGFAFGQGMHTLGTTSTFHDSAYPSIHLWVTSAVLDPQSVSFVFDFTQFEPAYYQTYNIDILGLKQDQSILEVVGNSTGFTTDGNAIHWQGTGVELQVLGTLEFKVFQTPAPGAYALIVLSALVSSRRRRPTPATPSSRDRGRR